MRGGVIGRWIGPVLVAMLIAALTYTAAMMAAPRFLMSRAISRLSAAGGMNRFVTPPLATDKARTVVRPSPDLAYAICPFDLSAGPVRVTVPAIPAVYWSLSVFDRNTDVAFVRNNRDTRGAGIDVAIVHGTQAAPAGIEAVRVDGSRGIALVRILVQDQAQFAATDPARRQATCTRVTR